VVHRDVVLPLRFMPQVGPSSSVVWR
jgi:hypothetical protein